MNELLARITDAHGGIDLWNGVFSTAKRPMGRPH